MRTAVSASPPGCVLVPRVGPDSTVRRTSTNANSSVTHIKEANVTNAQHNQNVSTNQDGKYIKWEILESLEISMYFLPSNSVETFVCNFFPRHLCECGAGYRAYQDPDLDGATVCVDEDECQLGTHSCQPSAKCWNTPGSYQCYCPHSQQSDLDHCSTGMY